MLLRRGACVLLTCRLHAHLVMVGLSVSTFQQIGAAPIPCSPAVCACVCPPPPPYTHPAGSTRGLWARVLAWACGPPCGACGCSSCVGWCRCWSAGWATCWLDSLRGGRARWGGGDGEGAGTHTQSCVAHTPAGAETAQESSSGCTSGWLFFGCLCVLLVFTALQTNSKQRRPKKPLLNKKSQPARGLNPPH